MQTWKMERKGSGRLEGIIFEQERDIVTMKASVKTLESQRLPKRS